MRSESSRFVRLCFAASLCAGGAFPAEAANILLLTKSSGFEHPVVKPSGQTPSTVETAVQAIANSLGHDLTSTKDASLINSTDLGGFDLVMFFTSGDLTQSGTDGQPTMSADGVADLVAWIEGGGGFIGVHSASDTFHSPGGGLVSPYIQMLGGEFEMHGAQFSGSLTVFDPTHLAMASVPDGYTLFEEWYLFENVDVDSIHALAVLDSREEGSAQPMYDVLPYPYTWCKVQGAGRIYYTGLAHNASTWGDATFRASLSDAIQWALGNGPAQAEPNFVPDPDSVWVDFTNPGIQIGTEDHPYVTVQQALDAAAASATIHLVAGESSETFVVNQAVRLEAVGGAVRIGVAEVKLKTGAAKTGFVSFERSR